jgi:hypothetical protein
VAVDDPPGQGPVGQVDHQCPQILIEDGHPAARSRDPDHLGQHLIASWHVEEDGDRDRGVEGPGRERQPAPVGHPEAAARARSAGAAPRFGDERPAGVHADDRATSADAGRDVPRHHAGPAAEVENASARANAGEGEERSAKPPLVRLGPPQLEEAGELERLRLGVDGEVGIGRSSPGRRGRRGWHRRGDRADSSRPRTKLLARGEDQLGSLNFSAQAGLQK